MDNLKQRASRTQTASGGIAPATQLRPLRFIILFAGAMLVAFGLLQAPFAQAPVAAFSRFLVSASALLVGICGGDAQAQGLVMVNPASGFAVEMANGCNGVHVMILLWSAVLAFPSSWKQKASGLAAGTAAIHSVNLVRFISLFYLGQYSRPWFDFAHLYLWETLIILDALVIFWLWAHLVFRSAAGAHAIR